MADDLHYVPGDFYRICERTGFKVRAGKTRPEWTQHIVRTESWEPRQPQDFVRGTPDDQTVPNARPRQTDVFLGPLQTTMAVSAAAGSTTLNVTLTTRMAANDQIEIILNNNDTFLTTIQSVVNQTQIIVNHSLPYGVSAGNLVTDITAVALPNIG